MKADRRVLVLALAYGASMAACCGAMPADEEDRAQDASLRYTVALESPQSQRVTITALLDGVDPSRPAVSWKMQRRFAFVRLPEPLLDGPIQATASGKPLDCERRGPYEWRVSPAGQTAMRLEYVVPLTHREIDAVKKRDAYEYPYVADDHALLVSPTLFVFPEELPIGEMRVRFELPEGWGVTAPWERVGADEFNPGDRESLLNDLIAVGKWHLHTVRAGDFEGTIAFAPGQAALELVAVAPISRIVEYELKLFGRPAKGRYLFLFGRPDGTGMAGSPKTRSMTLSVEPRLAVFAAKHLGHLIAHEFYHTWASARCEMPDELRWLNEGITDYYAYLVAARLRLNSWEDFAKTLGERMAACAVNPQRGKLSLVEVGGEVFFAEGPAHDLVYAGGMLLGAWLDRSIRAREGGETLDDLMRAFVNDPRWSKVGAAPTNDDLFAVARQFAGKDTAAKLERFVTQPYAFDPVVEFAELGIAVQRQVAPAKLDLRANLDRTRVLDMDHGALAYSIGIREGDRLIEVNGRAVTKPGEVHRAWRKPADERIRVTLEREGKTMTIDEPLPQVERFAVPVEPWREHADRSDGG